MPSQKSHNHSGFILMSAKTSTVISLFTALQMALAAASVVANQEPEKSET